MYRKYSVKRVNLLRTGRREFIYAQIVVPDGLELRRNTVFRNHNWAELEAHAPFLKGQIFCLVSVLPCSSSIKGGMRDEQIFHKFKPKHLLHSRFILEGIDKQSQENEQRDRRSSVDNSI